MKRAAMEKNLVKKRRIRREQYERSFGRPDWLQSDLEDGRYRKMRPLGCPVGCMMCTGWTRRKWLGNSKSGKTRQELKADGGE